MILKNQSRALFSGSSFLSLVSLLLILSMTSIALIRASADQTGDAVSGISAAFHNALLDGASSVEPQAISPLRTLIGAPESQNPETTLDQTWLSRRPLGARADPGENRERQTEATGDAVVFRNLINELRRLTEVSAVEPSLREISIDFAPSTESSATTLAAEVAELVRQACDGAGRRWLEFELTVWSSSPSGAAWTRAATDAANLQKQVGSLLRDVAQPVATLSSSSRIWTSRSKSRPAVTILIRYVK